MKETAKDTIGRWIHMIHMKRSLNVSGQNLSILTLFRLSRSHPVKISERIETQSNDDEILGSF